MFEALLDIPRPDPAQPSTEAEGTISIFDLPPTLPMTRCPECGSRLYVNIQRLSARVVCPKHEQGGRTLATWHPGFEDWRVVEL